MSHHHVSFKDLPQGGEKFEVAKASKLMGALGALGGLGLLLSLVFFFNPGTRPAFAYSWLFAIFVSFTLVVGGTFWVLLHNASNASWGVSVRRLFENLGHLALPLGLLSLPLLLPVVQTHIWPWMNHHREAAEQVAAHGGSVLERLEEMAKINPHLTVLPEKFGYLNRTFWYIRFFAYFGILGSMAWYMRGRYLVQELDGSVKHTIRARQFACAMLFPFALTVTFAAVDWLMALDYNWFSTMWGVYIFAGSAWSSMALMLLVVSYLRSLGYLQKVVTGEHYHLMGKLLLTFTIFWAYIAFDQYFLIWYANIPEETRFFLIRNTEGWRWVSILLLVGHFVLPFVVLLQQQQKKNVGLTCAVAVWVLVMHIVDIYWNIIPMRGPTLGQGVWMGGTAWMGDIIAFCTVFGILGYLYMLRLTHHSLYAWRDPRLVESINVRN